MERKEILRIIMICLIAFAIIMQIKVTLMIFSKEDLLNADPLAYGARKYGIESCTCFISNTKSIWFNQTMSKTYLRQGVPEKLINWSNIKLE